jgi:1-acyl-sn-glycerol-3-phosphate acyltransferase
MKRKTIYYNDELNDDFSGVTRKTLNIDGKYKYLKKGFFWNFFAFIVYRMMLLPFAFCYMKIKFHHKIVGKSKLKKDKGYFLFGNHTLMAGDAFVPSLISFPKKAYVLVHPDNISIPIVKIFIEMAGALPLSQLPSATKNLLNAVNEIVNSGNIVQIYPEAHIWPYYTGVRPFKSTSFKYAIKFNKQVFCFTNTFHKRRLSKLPRIITYIDGPFEVDKSISKKEQQEMLRDEVYRVMCDRAKCSTYNYHNYIKKE